MTGDSDIRRFEAGDLPALYRICRLTGANGQDASAEFTDPELLGHFYAAPYAVSEPELCFVALDTQGEVAGYILGTGDSEGFSTWCERAWFPALRSRLPQPAPDECGSQAAVLRLIHAGYRAPAYAG
ncbi:MAG: GNAT family N-acetyltransferase, partial [Opitutaceae bacterium]|nr:GNAT family N-acetyltransferase [Opitutaceae bacterium]